MGSNENSVQLKVFIDKKKKKVMFAEAEEDFVETLFSFFTLPLGTIARLTRGKAYLQNMKVGSLTSLYESVVNLNDQHFSNKHCKDALVNPNNASVSVLRKLKINLHDTNPDSSTTVGGCHDDAVFVKKKASFIITDDLNVVPVLLDANIELLNSLGVEYIDLLDKKTICFGLDEFSNLLKWSLLTNNPLTNLVVSGSKLCPCSCSCLCCCSYSSCIANSILSNSSPISKNCSRSRTMKLLVQKSKKKVLCAQVENFFVELLFSFLTIPLGAVKRLTKDNSSPMGIDNLYASISRLGDGKYLKSDDVKTMLLCPKLAANYLRVTDFLPVYDVNTSSGQFLKEGETFVVSDDLEVTVSPSISTILKFNTLGIPVGDIEVREVNIGEQEALLILKASVTSTSALTDCLYGLTKKPNATSFVMEP
ncbi:hypothetical protein L6452_36903 [Arctium lappa]|uniref:Uncharacterized protein n=1 Tax=Arctium lappa TaxID=4217 RepID=A0ACB8Y287_ARCLA|nr:hypothetical protein L6452_36903 [Arctium lappa]